MIKKTKFYLLFIGVLSSMMVVAAPLNGFSMLQPESSNTDVNVLSSSSFSVCYSEKSNVQLYINLRNSGLDTISNLQLGWFFTADKNGTLPWTGTITAGDDQNVYLGNLSLPSEGDFNVLVWATAGNGDLNPSNDTFSISVHVFDPFVVDEIEDTTVCVSTPINLSITPNYFSYLWSDGTSSHSTSVTQDGVFSVSVTDENGCESVDSMILDYFDSPSELLPGDTVFCNGDIFQLGVDASFVAVSWNDGSTNYSIDIDMTGLYIANVTDTMGCNYTDTLQAMFVAVPQPGTPNFIYLCDGDSVTVTADSAYNSYNWSTGDSGSSIVISTPGNYVVTVLGPTGCVGVDTMQVTASPLPVVDFNDSVICNGNPIILDGGVFNSYQWSDGSVLQSIFISNTGMYAVTVTDLHGCESFDSIDVTGATVTIDLGNDTTICAGDPVLIYLTGYDEYIWNDGDTNGIKWLVGAGTYAITVTNGGCSVADIIMVDEIDYPVASFSQQVTSPDVQFTNLSNMNTGFSWTFGDGGTSVQSNPLYSYSQPGTYQVVLSVTNFCGVDSLVSEVVVYPQSNHNIYLTNSLLVYPTIATEHINFTLSDISNSDIEYMVFDVSGKLLFQKKEFYVGPDYVYQVDISRFAAGTYYLRLSSGNTLMATQPFVKK